MPEYPEPFNATGPDAWEFSEDKKRLTIYLNGADGGRTGFSLPVEQWKTLCPTIASAIVRAEAGVGTSSPLGTAGAAEQFIMLTPERVQITPDLTRPIVTLGMDPDRSTAAWFGFDLEKAERLARGIMAAIMDIRRRDQQTPN